MWWRVGLLAFYLTGPVMVAADVNTKLRVVAEYHHLDDNGLFAPPKDESTFSDYSSRQEIDLTYNHRGIQGQALLRNQLRHGHSAENKAILNELYWDTQVANQDISVGKKVINWGVGFGFRPLDVIQKENRRRLYNTPQEGVAMFVWEHFGSTTSSSVIIANPHHGKENEATEDASFTFKLYQLQDSADLHAVLRLSERHHWEAGGGISYVVGDHLTWHASLLYQKHYQRLLNTLVKTSTGIPLASNDPLQQVTFEDGIKALIGSSWTSSAGWSILGEIWYDTEAYTSKHWHDLVSLTEQQHALLNQQDIPQKAVFSNIAASSRYFQSENLLRWNTLIRLAYDGEDMDPSLDLLYTPEDEGHVLTLNLSHQYNRHQVDFILRRYGGPSDAAYQLLPDTWVTLITWEWALR